MPEITVTESTFERLQHHAKPFVDTPDMVISRALDVLDEIAGHVVPENGYRIKAERSIDSHALPDMIHTKVLDASIDGDKIARPNWNSILVKMLLRTMNRVDSFVKLQHLIPINMVKGEKVDDGFSYLSEIDVSFQGQDSNRASRAIVMAAQELGVALDIGFLWRSKDAAAYPGERGRIQVAGSKSTLT